jgi:hypothetical protein
MIAVVMPISQTMRPSTPVGPAAGAPQTIANPEQQAAEAQYKDVVRQLSSLRPGGSLMMLNPDPATSTDMPYIIVSDQALDKAAEEYSQRTFKRSWLSIKRSLGLAKEKPATSGTSSVAKPGALQTPPPELPDLSPMGGIDQAARLAELKAAAPTSKRFAAWKASLPKPPTPAEIDAWINTAAQAALDFELSQATKK